MRRDSLDLYIVTKDYGLAVQRCNDFTLAKRLDIRASSFKMMKCVHAGSESGITLSGPVFSWRQN
jgi:hypothetical protein